jgi:UDP-GlcNAc:undecaprenyl-phosphate GlcNAc-1-phosphate transferase
LAFVLGTIIAVPLDTPTIGLLIGAVAVVAIILVDDFRDLAPRDKFLGQLVAAAIPIAFGVRIDGISNPFGGIIFLSLVVAIPFTLFWIAGMMNALNFVDGVDGLAGGVAVVAAAVLVVLSVRLGQYAIATMGLAVVGATLGFLPFNFYRASIFMGDSGAHLLGYLIGVLAIIGGAKIATALLVLGIPILDVAWTVVRRVRAGGKFHARDTDHLHHRLLRAGFSQRSVVLAYYAVGAAFGVVALYFQKMAKLYALGALALLMIATLYWLARWDRSSPREDRSQS